MARERARSLPNCFLAWLHTDGRDLLQEITVVRRRHKVDIVFQRFPRTLSGCLHHDRISVAAIKGKECFDYIFDADVSPQQTFVGWVCAQCPEPQLFGAREDLYRDHLFEPFRAWVFGSLASKNCVEFVSLLEGATMVKLRTELEVPPWIVRAHESHSRRRDELERSGSSRDDLNAFDQIAASIIDDFWQQESEAIDYDQLERDALLSLGPGGVEYLDGLTDSDFTEFNHHSFGEDSLRDA